MDAASIDAILEYLNGMASTISAKNIEELRDMKAGLDEYVEGLISQLPQHSMDNANNEFDKCRICAREWICVYSDPSYHPGTKADILKVEVEAFFFTMDEKIVAVQKNFFLLGMIDEILKPGEPFSKQQREAKIANSKIRLLAKEQNLTASCKTSPAPNTGISSKDRLWYFGDETNFLQSSESGLTDEEAIDYLLG